MDGEEFSWNVDDSTLSSFMSSYPRVPEHLRKRKRTGVEVGNVAEEVEGNKTPLYVPNEDWEDNQPLANLGRARRRLMKHGTRVVSDAEHGPTPEVTILNNLVSVWSLLRL